MKLQVITTIFLTLFTFVSSTSLPGKYDLYRRKQALYRRQDLMSNSTTGINGTNGTNGTTGGSGSGASSGTVPIIVVGGASTISNGTAVSNFTGVLNSTQLFTILRQVNQSLSSSSSSSSSQGIVIIASKSSFESIAFFLAITVNTNKTIVVCDDARLGRIVATDAGSQGRGPLIVGKNKVIFSGTLPPWGVPDGVIGDNDEAYWFTDACPPLLIAENSTLRTQFTNFTSTNVSSNVMVPIVFEEGISTTLLNSVSSFIQGLVVISSGSNATSSSQSSSIPIVYTSPKSKFVSFISDANIPSGAIAGGYLSPIQAQILLSVAIANGVNNTQSLTQIFPS
ncbi:hypothetical protein RI543_001324 [Arxiozyma heterogenica]|uniref:Uncharacterized protein n=1 Tax=Arxiozyma heterogenica TaxID=278026 RepID=A0AAN7WS18_9SACH|nr:hypothetical protein RI543_001324 [Kazachstania heterogenica]